MHNLDPINYQMHIARPILITLWQLRRGYFVKDIYWYKYGLLIQRIRFLDLNESWSRNQNPRNRASVHHRWPFTESLKFVLDIRGLGWRPVPPLVIRDIGWSGCPLVIRDIGWSGCPLVIRALGWRAFPVCGRYNPGITLGIRAFCSLLGWTLSCTFFCSGATTDRTAGRERRGAQAAETGRTHFVGTHERRFRRDCLETNWTVRHWRELDYD